MAETAPRMPHIFQDFGVSITLCGHRHSAQTSMSFNYHVGFLCEVVTKLHKVHLPPLALCCSVTPTTETQPYIYRGLHLQLPFQELHLYMITFVCALPQCQIFRGRNFKHFKTSTECTRLWTFCHCVTFIYIFGVLRHFQHCTGHITTGSWKDRGTSTYSSLGFCTVNCRPTASNYQLSHLRPCRESNPGLRGGRRECYHSATMAPPLCYKAAYRNLRW